MRPISQQMLQVCHDAGGNPLVSIEARVESPGDIRQRADQWILADGGLPANIEVLADGGIRLKATAGAAVGSTVANATYRAKESGIAGPYIDPIGSTRSITDQFIGISAQWNGTQAAVAYGSVQAWLNPRVDTTKPKYVQTWECIIYTLLMGELDRQTGDRVIQLVPVIQVQADAKGTESAGWVVFPFQDATGKSAPWHPDPYLGDAPNGFVAHYLVVCHGYDAKGHRCSNIGWSYDNAHTSFSVGAGNNTVNLFGHTVHVVDVLPAPRPEIVAASVGLPAFQFIPVSYASSATVTFKTGVPIDLGATPSAASLVEFVVKAEVPTGATVLAEAALDPVGSFGTVKDGQTADVLLLAAQRKYDVRVTLTASAAGDRTPIVRALGARVVAKTDLGDWAEVVTLTEQTDPITHQTAVEEAVIRVIHDGERDYKDAISLLLSQNPPGVLYYRLYVGHARLARDLWMHHDDYFPDDVQLEDAYVDLICVSALSQLRQELPVLSSDAVAAPVADSSNPGAWTASTGTVLYPQIADLPEPPWAATTAYLAGQRVIDANSNVQLCTVAGTTAGGAPTWNTGLGGYTIDSTVTWQNLGPVASGLPDDKTYIQSPVNPVSADYIATLGAIGTPQQSVGAMIQFRAATAAGGQSLNVSAILREGSTTRATKTVTINVADTGQGSYTPVQYILTAAEQASIGNWGNLNMIFRANGTGQIRVGWARLVVLGRRVPYVSSSIGPNAQAIMDDIINNQIALDGRLKGQQYVDPSPGIPVSKTVEQPPGGSTDLARAKAELDALAWITGTFYMSTQGKVTNRPLYQVATGTDLITGTTTATFSPLTGPVRAIFPIEEAEPLSITPGWRQRIPLFRVPWGWNGQNWAGEAQVINAPALNFYRAAMIEADARCPTETAKWIGGDGLARGLSARHSQAFGLGLMLWRFRTTYPNPHLERGDVVVLGTDRFVGFDPIATRGISGKQWVTAVIVGRYDALGREWAVLVQSLSAIRPIGGALAFPPFNAMDPITARPIWRDNRLFVHANTRSGVASIKVATSTSAYPAAGTGTSTDGSDVLFDAGTFPYWSTVYVTVTGYSDAGGTGIQRSVTQFTTKLPGLRYPDFNPHQMLPNNGFEDGMVFVIRNQGNSVVVVTDSTKAHSGNKYLEITSTTGGQTNGVASDDAGTLRTFEVQPGDVIQFGGFANRQSGTDNVRFLLQARDKDNVFVSNTATAAQNTAAYLLVQGEYLVPAGVKYVTIFADVDGSGTATVGRFDDWFLRVAFNKSTVHNPQGSILPVPFGASLFTGAWGGLGAGQMFVAFSWASQTLFKPDGSSVTLPAPPAALAAPTLTQQAGGVRGATTLFARIGLFKDGHLEALSAESSLAVLANNVLKITSPTNPGGYDKWMPLVGNVTNAEYVQASGAPPNSGPLDFGTDYVEPNAHFTTIDTQYAAAMLGALVYLDLQPSTTYYFYPFYDAALGFARFAPFNFAVGITAPSMANANQAWSDGRIALSGSGMAITVGAGGGSGSPTTGGSRLT